MAGRFSPGPITDSRLRMRSGSVRTWSRETGGASEPAALGGLSEDFGNVRVHRDSATGAASNAAAREATRTETEDEAAAPQLVEIPKDKDEAWDNRRTERDPVGGLAPGPVNVATVLAKGQPPRTTRGAAITEALDRPHGQAVNPGGVPTTGNASNDCKPSTASAVVAWNVVEADATNWGVDVTSLTLAGQVNVAPWTSNPTSMTVPNTPNPVDGGNINNTAGSTNHWQAAIDDMADYNTVGGGRGPNWHSTAASSAHEWAHWNTDYVTDSVGSRRELAAGQY